MILQVSKKIQGMVVHTCFNKPVCNTHKPVSDKHFVRTLP